MNNIFQINQPSSLLQQVQNNNNVTPGEAHEQFASSLKNAIDKVNQAQVASDQKTEALARGEITDLHDVMVTAKKASITMQLSVEMQNKAIEAYREIMRMQV
ncbi:flagellar hook-basal body complex protein FliE [Thalassobacillus pellis]|uniref:flagellar hook-basal body complex protein FliE n=1 Tax=Thalassobacillus pellis TaxID=748008 RepID=UPI0019604E38|nr:flagellar hook-basal body complex protein FliE [Thalassobacillus pellis]MBM7552754.1 flagellar hook-basal body complex protein FliE [Thalassobacillus pellis]